MNKQTANSSVNKLKKDGLIKFSPGAGREIKLFLTDFGKNIVNEKILPVEETEREVFDEMTEAERKEILRLLHKYLSAFRAKLEGRELL